MLKEQFAWLTSEEEQSPLNETFSSASGKKIYSIPSVLADPLWVCVRHDGSELFLLEINWLAHPNQKQYLECDRGAAAQKLTTIW